MPTQVAIIIPAGPGDGAWRTLLPQLANAAVDEIVLALVDGDNGLSESDLNIRVVHSPAGRALQLNVGAKASRAEWLWFVHADSVVPGRTLDAMHAFVSEAPDAIGYFRLGFVNDGPALMFINAWGAALRSEWLGLPFGDQGLLMKRTIFEALGGFDESVEKGEDHALIWAARARGIPLRAIKATLRTSARRYAENGWWRTTMAHVRMTRDQAKRFSRRTKLHEAIDRS